MNPRDLSKEGLNAVIAEEAADIDQRRARGEEDGPLHRTAGREQRSYHISWNAQA